MQNETAARVEELNATNQKLQTQIQEKYECSFVGRAILRLDTVSRSMKKLKSRVTGTHQATTPPSHVIPDRELYVEALEKEVDERLELEVQDVTIFSGGEMERRI